MSARHHNRQWYEKFSKWKYEWSSRLHFWVWWILIFEWEIINGIPINHLLLSVGVSEKFMWKSEMQMQSIVIPSVVDAPQHTKKRTLNNSWEGAINDVVGLDCGRMFQIQCVKIWCVRCVHFLSQQNVCRHTRTVDLYSVFLWQCPAITPAFVSTKCT